MKKLVHFNKSLSCSCANFLIQPAMIEFYILSQAMFWMQYMLLSFVLLVTNTVSTSSGCSISSTQKHSKSLWHLWLPSFIQWLITGSGMIDQRSFSPNDHQYLIRHIVGSHWKSTRRILCCLSSMFSNTIHLSYFLSELTLDVSGSMLLEMIQVNCFITSSSVKLLTSFKVTRDQAS